MREDPTGGEDLVADGEEGRESELAPQSDPQLLLYQSLQGEAQSRILQHQRSLLSGISVIGVIIAYALLSGRFVFLAVIPLVIGFLVVQSVRFLNNLYFITRHLARIERAYIDEYPLFDWEYRYGIAGTDRTIARWGLNWSIVPQVILLVLAVFGYLGSIYAGYVLWPPSGVEILILGLTRGGLLVIYTLLTGLMFLAGYSFYLHRSELSPDDA